MGTVLLIILYSSLFGIFWIYGGYYLFLSIVRFFVKRGHLVDENFFPTVTLMIMTHNEERVIAAKIQNSLELRYPKEKLEIMVVDSASTDATASIVARFHVQNVRWISQPERRGKGAAIRFGMEHARGDIIIISDANSPYSAEAVRHLVKHFADERVGGVTGRYISRDLKGTEVGRGGKRYWEYERLLKEKETAIDSCIQMSGEMSAIRRADIDVVPTDSLAEDFDMSVALRRKGKLIIFEPDAEVWEPTPTDIREEIIQKKRRIIGTIQTLIKHRRFLLSLRNGWYSKLIVPSHKILPLISPLLIVLFFISSLTLPAVTALQFYSALFWLSVFVLFLSVLSWSPLSKVFTVLKMIKYLLLLQFIVFLGWVNFFSGRYSVTWEKILGSREL